MIISRKLQLIAFTAITYFATLWSVYLAIKSSGSYLQVTIKLTQGFNVIIITIFTLLNSAFLWKLTTFLLFGPLRLIEYEHILERLPFTIMNTLFMSSILNENDVIFTGILFGALLLYMKVSHWILKDRLEAMLQTIDDNTTLSSFCFSNRFLLNLIILTTIDYKMMSYCIANSLSNGLGASTSIHLMLGMEFAMLLVDLFNIFLQFGLNIWEFYCSYHRSNTSSMQDLDVEEEDDESDIFDDSQFNGLEGKFMYEKAIDIFTRFVKTVIHIIMLFAFKIPALLIKDIIWDFFALYKNSFTLWKTWRNNKQLDDKLPTVSLQELQNNADNNICIVCMDDLFPDKFFAKKYESHTSQLELNTYKRLIRSKQKKPKKLPCSHILHLGCLKNWMERSQTCPICRLPVFDENGSVLPSVGRNESTPPPPPPPQQQQQQQQQQQPQVDETTVGDNLDNTNGMSIRHQPNTLTPTPTTRDNTAASENTETFDNDSEWYYFPITAENATSISFDIKFLKDNRVESVPAQLQFVPNGNLELVTNDDGELVKRITIPDDAIIQTKDN